MDIKRRLEIVKNAPKMKGQSLYIKYLQGDRLPASQAILCKCYGCMGYYADGKQDCKMPDCSLYPWMPYKGMTAPVREQPFCLWETSMCAPQEIMAAN